MSDKWFDLEQASAALGCSAETVRAMLREGLLPGRKTGDQWQIKVNDLERTKAHFAANNHSAGSPQQHQVDAGMVEVNIALAGIAAAIAALISGVNDIDKVVRFVVALLVGTLAVFSAYSALWLLARYCTGETSELGRKEIFILLTNPAKFGPHWFVALSLVVCMALSALLSALILVK